MRHTLSCLVKNGTGVLGRVATGIAEAGISIHSMAVSETEDVDTSLMTLVVDGGDHTYERIRDHIGRLDDIVEVQELRAGEFLSRQMILVTVRAQGDAIARVMQVAELTRATVLDVGRETMTVELTGEEEQMTTLVRMLRPLGIVELARSGRIAVKRGT